MSGAGAVVAAMLTAAVVVMLANSGSGMTQFLAALRPARPAAKR